MPPADTCIRPMLQEDLEQVLTWRNHPDVRYFMYSQHKIALEEHEKWFQKCQKDPRIQLLIFEMDQLPMGFANIKVTSEKVADWGFYTAPDAPKGTGKQLANTVLNYAFNVSGIHKICGQALDFNERSIKFHLKHGFKHEGTLREQYFDGTIYHDVLCFGLISHEWDPIF